MQANRFDHLTALKDAIARPVWHDPAIMPELEPPLESDQDCELLIVGGGFTGLWAALQVMERKPDTDIILIEKTFVADGASGRCGGVLSTSLAHGETNAAARFADEFDQLEALGTQNIKEFLETLDRYDIDARYEHTGETTVVLNETGVSDLREEYEEEKAKGSDVVWFDKEGIQEQVRSPLFQAGLWRRDGQDGIIDPARLCFGLKRVLLEKGVRIFEETPLIDIEESGKDGMKGVCEGGTVNCRKILMATNAFQTRILGIRRSVIPVWDYQIATEPLNDEQCEAIGWHKSRHAVSDHVNMFHYLRITKDNRITFGGGGSVRYYFNKGTDPSLMNQPERYQELAREFFEFFPQLKDLGVRFSHKWGGMIATSTRFCMVPGTAYEGRVAWSLGYTGHGVGASRFGARIAIEMLGYEPSDILHLQFVTRKALPWAPEPFRWIGIRLTHRALVKADQNDGKRGLWLKFLDKLGLGFTC